MEVNIKDERKEKPEYNHPLKAGHIYLVTSISEDVKAIAIVESFNDDEVCVITPGIEQVYYPSPQIEDFHADYKILEDITDKVTITITIKD